MNKSLRICIDARLRDATIGGGAKVVIALASALSKLEDGDEEYHFYTSSDANAWLRPYLKGPCHLFAEAAPERNSLKKRLARVKWINRTWSTVGLPITRLTYHLPQEDKALEDARFDLIHFTQQHAFLTSIPSIYQPHDLQHLHLPHLFTPRERFLRSVMYPSFCKQAAMVVAMSTWGKKDLINHLDLPESKIAIIPWAPWRDAPVPSNADIDQTRRKFNLPSKFLFFPAQTWRHKNHLGALEALRIARDRAGLRISLICSGQTNDFFPTIRKRIRELDLVNQVSFVGFINELELQCLYRLARALIFPTKFEGWGLPVSEAFLAGTPVICSDVTCLPDQAGDAALLFPPDDYVQMAQLIVAAWNDDSLCETLRAKGHARAAKFSWDRTARLFRAHYRRILSRALTAEDKSLLTAPSQL